MVRIEASTLTEVVVAMVLLSIVTTVAILIYFNTIRVLYNTQDIRLGIWASNSMNTYVDRREKDTWSQHNEEGDQVTCMATSSLQWENVYIVECIATDSTETRSASLKQAIYLRE